MNMFFYCFCYIEALSMRVLWFWNFLRFGSLYDLLSKLDLILRNTCLGQTLLTKALTTNGKKLITWDRIHNTSFSYRPNKLECCTKLDWKGLAVTNTNLLGLFGDNEVLWIRSLSRKIVFAFEFVFVNCEIFSLRRTSFPMRLYGLITLCKWTLDVKIDVDQPNVQI
jgi:hypothetical protein